MEVGVDDIQIRSEVLQQITSAQAYNYRIIPTSVHADHIELFIAEKIHCLEIKNELEIILNKAIVLNVVPDHQVDLLLSKYYRHPNQTGSKALHVSTTRMESFIEDVLKEAKDIGSSDIHIESLEGKCRVRLRIDGYLIEKYELDNSRFSSLINKIKVKANLDIAEKRLPQDGRIQYRDHGDSFDIRVSVIPTLNSEKVVMRILHQDQSRLDLSRIGMSEAQLQLFQRCLYKEEGIILISGPTGSGKTTTLYSALKVLNTESVNICTVEDPVEYTLEGINQIHVKDSIGLTFASALRSFLRQDPDIIMLGEIRDSETAQMALRASLTGHRVLSTIHTNSAIETITRLKDMGLPGFLIASTVKLSVAQRLVRRLCDQCKSIITDIPSESAFHSIQLNGDFHMYEANGCENCHMSGYKGRVAIYEMLEMNPDIQSAIRQEHDLYQVLPGSYKTLRDTAIDLVRRGITTEKEVFAYL